MKFKVDPVKTVGLVATLAGVAVTAASNWVQNKQLDATITEKVTEALKNQTKES